MKMARAPEGARRKLFILTKSVIVLALDTRPSHFPRESNMARLTYKVATDNNGRILFNTDNWKLVFSAIVDGEVVEFQGKIVGEPKLSGKDVTIITELTRIPREFNLKVGKYTIVYETASKEVSIFTK